MLVSDVAGTLAEFAELFDEFVVFAACDPDERDNFGSPLAPNLGSDSPKKTILPMGVL